MELFVCDRNYAKWYFKPIHENEPLLAISDYIHPLTCKFFHRDIISTTGSLIHSPYQSKENIPGVLLLEGKTYGRTLNNASSNNSKLLYKCVPEDPALPCFLIPYEDKVASFQKKKTNKYITFRIKEWQDKHPLGQINTTIGDVSDPENYYHYQLASKYLQKSITRFNKETIVNLNWKPRANLAEQIAIKQQLVDRRSEPIFSIDPAGCKDIDDAIGLRSIDKHHSVISIYIANVPLIMDDLYLWQACSERVSSIYLPNSKVPMLPTILSDDICSLVQGKDRCAFALDIAIEQTGSETVTVTNVTFTPALVKVLKNYAYEEDALLKNKTYSQLFQLTKLLMKQYPYVEQLNDSHELIEFYMIFMNYESSKRLLERKTGIFRSATLNKELTIIPPGLSKDTRTFLQSYQLTQCHYCTYDQVQPHDLLGLRSYVHITSPIRRLVDLLNLCELQDTILSGDAKLFTVKWMKRLDYINTTMKAIRKVQNNCNLLATYLKDKKEGRYTGLLFEKTLVTDGVVKAEAIYKPEAMYKFKIYIPALKMVSTIKTTQPFDNYRTVVVAAYSFMDEDNVMKKIRLQIA